MRKILLATAAVIALAQQAPAQQSTGTQIWWNASRADVASFVATSATTTVTQTLTPASGQYVYVTAVRLTNCAATAVTPAAVTSVTTTNLGGAAWTVASGATAGLCAQDVVDTFGGAPLKAAAPGAVTFVNPTFATNQTVRVTVYWYSAP